MKKYYDNILFDESGESIPLSADEFIEYLLESLCYLQWERDCLKKQMDQIWHVLTPKNHDDF